MFYLIFFTLFLILNLNYKRLSFNLKFSLRLFSVILFVVFLGFRENVGKDFENYSNYYSNILSSNYLELGFDYLNLLLAKNNISFIYMFAIMAAISIFFIFTRLFLSKEIIYLPSALLIVVFGFMFLSNGVRQGVAISIFFFSYQFIKEKKLFMYILAILFASLFHLSALYLLPIYFFARKEYSKKGYFLIVVIITFILFNIDFIIDRVDYFNYFQRYQERLVISDEISLGTILLTLFNMFVLLTSFYKGIYKNHIVIFNLFFIYCVLLVLQSFIGIVGRFTIYFEWFSYLWVPLYLVSFRSYMENKTRKAYSLIIIILYVIVAINAYMNFDSYSFYFTQF